MVQLPDPEQLPIVVSVSSKYTVVDWQLPLPNNTWSVAHILLAFPSALPEPAKSLIVSLR